MKFSLLTSHWHTTHVNILVHITYRWLMPLGDDTIQDQDENLEVVGERTPLLHI